MATPRSPKSTSAPGPTAATGDASEAASPHDYEGARQLLSRYCTLIDRGKLVELSELFHLEAIFSVSFDSADSHVGREAILAWYTQFFQERRGQARLPRHKLFEPHLLVSGDTGTSTAYFDSDFLEPSGAVRVLAGRYDDVLIKVRSQWFFKQRTITVNYNYSPGNGQEGMVA